MLREVSILGTTILMYDFFNALSVLALLVYAVICLKKYQIFSPRAQKSKNAICVALFEMAVLFIVATILVSVLNPRFGKWFTHGNANYYGTLTAWFITFLCVPILFGVSPLKTMDLLSPAAPLQLVFAKLACFFNGCCWSYEVAHSFYYSQYHNRYEIPVQLVEAGVALLLFFFLLWQKKRSRRNGFAFPLYLTIYSVSRFFTEFLRGDLPNELGPFNAYQLLSIFFTILGMILLWLVWKFGTRIDAYYEKKFSAADQTDSKTGEANQT